MLILKDYIQIYIQEQIRKAQDDTKHDNKFKNLLITMTIGSNLDLITKSRHKLK